MRGLTPRKSGRAKRTGFKGREFLLARFSAPPSAGNSFKPKLFFVPILLARRLKILQIVHNSFAVFVLFFAFKIYLNKINF